ncbi:MAG TPA: glutathione S-transferase family protein [Steroidobacteraceae bacterium]|jgi:glutathione S-transferase|nr:glutathione S-transferase family protein [Steroidobacteraceae bacterium]
MKLYHFPASTFARRVRVALLEKNIACELIEVNLPAGQHKEEWYAALNPYLKVPTLVDGDLALYESAAILSYLEATHPSPPLVPHDAGGRALVDMHVRLCDAHIGRYAGAILFPKRFLPEANWDRQAMEAARKEVDRHLAIIERELGERHYLVGQTFTLADIAYLPFLHFLGMMEINAGPRVKAWAERVLARPSAKATVPAR